MANAMVRGVARELFGANWFECSKAAKAVRKAIARAILAEGPLPRPSHPDFATAVRAAQVALVDTKRTHPGYGMATLVYNGSSWHALNCACEEAEEESLDPLAALEAMARTNCGGEVHGSGFDASFSWPTTPLELHIERSAWERMGPVDQARARKLSCPCCARQMLVLHVNAKWPEG
jgi:hypothetical protein